MNVFKAMQLIRDFSAEAGCTNSPDVRIVFKQPADHMAFSTLLASQSKAAGIQRMTAPQGSDGFEVGPIYVEVYNTDRGSRAQANKIMERATLALQNTNRPTLTMGDMKELRDAAADLLRMVKG